MGRNERLRSAMLRAGTTATDLAAICRCDPKTVDRWVTSGRVPYPRHRVAAARHLRVAEEFLWPDVTSTDEWGQEDWRTDMRNRPPVLTATRWRKRRLAIEAMPYDGTPEVLDEITMWSGGRVSYDRGNALVVVASPEGPKYVNKGDWVIRGVLGEFYPVSSVVFEATYDPVDETDDHRAILTAEQVTGVLDAARQITDPVELRELLALVVNSHEAQRETG